MDRIEIARPVDEDDGRDGMEGREWVWRLATECSCQILSGALHGAVSRSDTHDMMRMANAWQGKAPVMGSRVPALVVFLIRYFDDDVGLQEVPNPS